VTRSIWTSARPRFGLGLRTPGLEGRRCRRMRRQDVRWGCYTVCYEQGQLAIDGTRQPARVLGTQIHRRENAEWKLVHRHGDFAPVVNGYSSPTPERGERDPTCPPEGAGDGGSGRVHDPGQPSALDMMRRSDPELHRDVVTARAREPLRGIRSMQVRLAPSSGRPCNGWPPQLESQQGHRFRAIPVILCW
jgi:hypothetical protein